MALPLFHLVHTRNKREHYMRQLLTVAFGLSLVIGGLGCSSKGVDLDKSKTIAWDKEKDGMPTPIGGPGSMGGKGKGKGGDAAPPK